MREKYISIIIFTLLFTPNIFFLFVSDFHVSKKIFLLILPIPILTLIFSILGTKLFTYFNLLLTPLLFIELFSLFNYHSFASFEFINSFFLTNKEEAFEIFYTYSIYIILLLILISFNLFLCFKARIYKTKKMNFNLFFISIALVVLSYLFTFINTKSTENKIKYGVKTSLITQTNEIFLSRLNNTSPFSFLYNTSNILKEKRNFRNYFNIIKDFKFNAHKEKSINQETYVLVIGESSRKHNFSAYGYQKKTTPNLDTISNILLFKNTISTSNNTAIAIPHILTRATPNQNQIKLEEPTLIQAFKEAGFKTYWLSNQYTNNETIYKLYSNQADVIYNREDLTADKTYFDGNIAPVFNKIIKEKNAAAKKLIIIHLSGSHFNYKNKYPKEFNHFKPTLTDNASINLSVKEELINTYDNSIRYTDFVLSKLIFSLKEQKNVSSFLYYISDHGENLFDDSNNYIFHSYPIPKKHELEVPFFIWTSKKYVENYPQKNKTLQLNINKKISSTISFHSIIDMAGIRYENQELSKSISSNIFNSNQDRHIYTTEGKIIKYHD